MQFEPGAADPSAYQVLLTEKIKTTEREFACFDAPPLEAFASPPLHFRMRAEFKVWHENGSAHYAMYQPGVYKKPVKVSRFAIGSRTMCDLMPALMAQVNLCEALRRKLFQVEFLTTTTGDSIITLIYHRVLDPAWKAAAEALAKNLGSHIIGRSRGQKVVLSRNFVIEEFEVGGRIFRYQQVETGFTQPNASVCQTMLNWCQQVSATCGGDLLELYCGNGNFTLPLAVNFEKVLATEVAKTSVKSARDNVELNRCENIVVVRMSSEEFTQAMRGQRAFQRLRDVDLTTYRFSTLFVDPPRAGLDPATLRMASQFENILYISCNPATLASNIETLIRTHEITSFALFDQFPYTDHRECGVLLRRNQATRPVVLPGR